MCFLKTRPNSNIPFQNLEKDTKPLAVRVCPKNDNKEITRTEFYLYNDAPQVLRVDYNGSKALKRELKDAKYFNFYYDRHHHEDGFAIVNLEGWDEIKNYLKFIRLTNN